MRKKGRMRKIMPSNANDAIKKERDGGKEDLIKEKQGER